MDLKKKKSLNTKKLSDFQIKVPQFLLMKLSEEIEIEISMLATTVPPKNQSEKE